VTNFEGRDVKRRQIIQGAGLLATAATFGATRAAEGTLSAAVPTASPAAAPVAVPTEEATQRLVQYAAGVRLMDLPDAVRHQGARTLLNWIGCAVGGSQQPAVLHALAAVKPFSGRPQAQLLGRHERLDALHAALVNGISAHVLDYDDTHLKTVIHPAASVMPALLALAEHHSVTGTDFLNALILGVEAECRIGNAVYPSHYDLGWHITGTCGVFGAALACGRLLKLSPQQLTWAVGLAASQPVGLKIQFGSMTKSFHPGRAAQNGLLAALLAQQGFTAAAASLEGTDGWAQAISREHHWNEVTEGLGSRFESALNTYKPFACGIVTHPAIDAAIQLRNEFKLQPEAITRVTLHANPLVLSLTGKRTPQTGLDGKFSIYHCIAAAIVFGAARERQFTDAAVNDPRVVALRSHVEVKTDADVAAEQCDLDIELSDGRKLTRHIEHAVGSVQSPMSDADLEAKLRDLATDVLPPARISALIDACWRIASLENAAAVAHAAAA
jgi:2-methylcitrate dehydratase PrpD